MKKNVAGQYVAAMVFNTDGTAKTTGTVTIKVAGDGGADATGSVGSGACTHIGSGKWQYAPAQAETNYDKADFVFVPNTGLNVLVQIYTSFPQTGDGFGRLGAPAGASVSADVAAVKAVLPAALVSGRIDASVGAMAANVLTAAAINADAITAAKIADGAIDAATFAAGAINAAAIAADAITDAKVASDVTIASVTGAVGSVTGAVGSVTGNVGGNVTGSVGSIAAGGIAAASFAAAAIDAAAIATDAFGALELAAGAASEIATAVRTELATELGRVDVAVSTRASQTSVDTIDDFIDTEVAAIKAKTDLIPASPAAVGDIPTAAAVADAVWDEALAGHATGGSAGAALSAAGSAGDPWSTPLPGAYGAGTAGKIVGDNIDAAISTRLATSSYTAPLSAAGTRAAVGLASANLDTQIDALPTNAELATALAAADDAVLAAIAALNNLSQANIRTAVGLGSANLDTQLGDLPTNAELATALGTADDAVLAAVAALNNLSAAGVRSAVGLASANLDTQLDALPTAAELATALGTADDAVLAQVALVKAKTDGLPADPADASDIAASFATIAAAIANKTGYRLSTAGVDDILRTTLTEGYAANGAAPTLEQGVFMLVSYLFNKGIIGTTLTANKLDGSTPAMTFTLDNGAAPTTQVRAT